VTTTVGGPSFWSRARRAGALAVALASAGVLIAAPSGAAEAPFPAFGLPMAPGQNVGSAGIHSDNGSTGVKNAIDLNPRDDVVRAPLAGTVRVQHCGGGDWITVDHADGWRTGYYHLENIVVADGQQVEVGAELGQVGNALPCGGSSSGAHVHFTLWRLDALGARSGDPIAAGNWDGVSYERLETEVAAAAGEALTGKVFGGWTLEEGTSQYSGSVTNVRSGETVRLPGSFRYDG
jgi:LasA protease